MEQKHDIVILGAGPAGLQLGYFLQRNDRDFVIIDRESSPASFFDEYPRHRMLLSINKVHTGTDSLELNMRWDWNSLICDNPELRLPNYTEEYFPDRKELVQYLADFADYYKLPIEFEREINRVSKTDDGFQLYDSERNIIRCRVLVVATGLSQENIPDIPGIELCDTYGTHSLDASKYTNKRVLVIGKGNSGFETADHLINHASIIHLVSPESVRLAWQTHFVGSLRAVNNNFIDTYQLKSQNAVIDGSVDHIVKDGEGFQVEIGYSHAMGQKTTRYYDHVIVCTGFRFDDSIFDENCKPDLTIRDRFPKQSTAWESENVPDMYFAGTIMQACDYKKTQSGFIHGFRNNIRALSWLLEERYYDKPWPADTFPATPSGLTEKIVERLGLGAGIFQQPGFLSEVFVINDSTGLGRHYREVRCDHIPNSHLAEEDHYYVVTLEYGRHHDNPLAVERDPDPEMGHEAFYLHPVIRQYHRLEQVGEHHVNDDLENEWFRPEYVEPLNQFVQANFSRSSQAMVK